MRVKNSRIFDEAPRHFRYLALPCGAQRMTFDFEGRKYIRENFLLDKSVFS
jgi:hypothetical protein